MQEAQTEPSSLPLPHILYFSTLRNWLQLLWRYGRQIDRPHRWRAVTITLFVVATVPVRFIESAFTWMLTRRHRLSEPPVFIIGHWRSGTTHLHNLLLQNPRFASVTLLHCAVPAGFIAWGWLARLILKSRLPASRPMDAVPLGLDEPMSEDFALAGLTHLSHYVSYFFPRSALRAFRETVLFQNVSAPDRRHWTQHYLALLRKVSWQAGGRRLLLKNPPNLGRVPELLRLFPDARFIHVVRDPYIVHASTLKLMDRFLSHLALQGHDQAELEQFVTQRYVELMETWQADRCLIPPGNLIEVRHEDVVARPQDIVDRVCRQFAINPSDYQPRLDSHIASLAGYQKNQYEFPVEKLNALRPALDRFARELGYDVR